MQCYAQSEEERKLHNQDKTQRRVQPGGKPDCGRNNATEERLSINQPPHGRKMDVDSYSLILSTGILQWETESTHSSGKMVHCGSKMKKGEPKIVGRVCHVPSRVTP